MSIHFATCEEQQLIVNPPLSGPSGAQAQCHPQASNPLINLGQLHLQVELLV